MDLIGFPLAMNKLQKIDEYTLFRFIHSSLFEKKKELIFPTSAIVRDLLNPHEKDEDIMIWNTGDKDAENNSIMVSMQIESLSPEQKFDGLDRSVMVALGNVWYEAKGKARSFDGVELNINDLCRRVFGLCESERPSQQHLDDVIGSIEKLMRMWVRIDATKHIISKAVNPHELLEAIAKKSASETVTYEGAAINVNTITFRYHKAYILILSPILFTYSYAVRQYAHIKREELKVTNRTDSLDLAHDILTRVVSMTQNRRLAKTIRADWLYKRYGLDATDTTGRKARQRLLDNARRILEAMIRQGTLSGYSERKGGRGAKVMAFELDLPKSKPLAIG